jgi:hypothetical protein
LSFLPKLSDWKSFEFLFSLWIFRWNFMHFSNI